MLRAALMLAVLACLSSPIRSADIFEPTNTLLILGAVPQEISLLTAALENPSQGEVWGIPFWRGMLHGKPVIIAITGVGKTFTAMKTTLLLTHFKPRMVIMTGTGARINPELRTGDVVIAHTTNFHDFGSLGPESMEFRSLRSPKNGALVENLFDVNIALVEIATIAAQDYPASTISVNGKNYTNKVITGVVSSSDLFSVTERRIKTLREQFGTDIMEMESAALALVCMSFRVPYLVIRSGSNLAQEKPNDDYLTLGPIAAREAAKFTSHLVKYL